MSSYTHVNNEVEALQLTKETKADITKALMEALSLGNICELTVTSDPLLDSTIITYKNVNSTNAFTLNTNDYLLKLNTGDYVVMTASEFESNYTKA